MARVATSCDKAYLQLSRMGCTGRGRCWCASVSCETARVWLSWRLQGPLIAGCEASAPAGELAAALAQGEACAQWVAGALATVKCRSFSEGVGWSSAG